MQRVGIGGVLLMDVDQGAPPAMRYLGKEWQAMFRHASEEASRLGLEMNFNNGAGWNGSGGPWITRENGMQTVVSAETRVTGGKRWEGDLAKPTQAEEYRDLAVLALAEPAASAPGRFEIPDLKLKSLQWPSIVPNHTPRRDPWATAPAAACVPLQQVIDLSAKMNPDGHLAWEVPPGEWTILRFGHTWTGTMIHPVPPEQAGPEVDKLSKEALAIHFNVSVKHLVELVGSEARGALVMTHIDSWECGGQNWTPRMRAEFQKRRRYDPVPYLPILTGRVLGDLAISERFLYDLRLTVSELMIENYTGEFQRLAHAQGLRNSFESFATLGNDFDNAANVDEPMAEFWTNTGGMGGNWYVTAKSMSSAAHVNGRTIIGAEAFTADEKEKWLWHPAILKSLGDEVFCSGVNRFIFHRFTAQPFGPAVQPGVQMGPWGLHYDRHNTWWEFTRPWHEYLTRCQYLLRQGDFVADVLRLLPEEPLHRFQDQPFAGYDSDAVGPATFLKSTVCDGRIVFPSGASYRLLLLPGTPFMSVEALTHVRDLVQAGGAILGEPPQQTPGLTDYPNADQELRRLVREIWGEDSALTERIVGAGHVFHRISVEAALAARHVPPDFRSDAGLHYIHRRIGATDVYFLSHAGPQTITARCTFRPMATRDPERWEAETGRRSRLGGWTAVEGEGTTVPIRFGPDDSAFVVFTPGTAGDPARPLSVEAPPLPGFQPMTIGGPWKVRFPAGWGAPAEIALMKLTSWHLRPEEGVRHFSGTATYRTTFRLPQWDPTQRIELDLGVVKVMAKVRLNGQEMATLWKPPFCAEITSAARQGENRLEIEVVNLWVNRLIGDEQLPEDSERLETGAIKTWPKWLLRGEKSPSGRIAFSSWRLWHGGDALQESGLLGPVEVKAKVESGSGPGAE